MPFHMIYSAPREVVGGFESTYRIKDLNRANIADIKEKKYDAVVSRSLELLDKAVDGTDNTVVMFPHLFDSLGAGAGTKLPPEHLIQILGNKRVHYIEGYNGMNSDRANALNMIAASVMRDEYGKGILVGADYHTPSMFGTCLNLVDAKDRDENSLLKAFRNYQVVGFENLKNINNKERIDWAVNRAVQSKDDIIRRSYTDGWEKDSWWANLLHIEPVPHMIRGTVNYAANHQNSKLWDGVATIAGFVNILFEQFRMQPKYNKFIREAIHGGGADDQISYDSLRKDPVKAMEAISAAPVARKIRCD
jgi:hypothetical protein